MERPWKRERVSVDELRALPGLTPKPDETLDVLYEKAWEGDVPVYFAAVPLALCVPFDLDYRPDLHPVGAAVIHQIAMAARKGEFLNLHLYVYPRGKWFIVADDYCALFAALEGLPDYVPCWVLGKPDSPLLRDVQGPLTLEGARKALFGD